MSQDGQHYTYDVNFCKEILKEVFAQEIPENNDTFMDLVVAHCIHKCAEMGVDLDEANWRQLEVFAYAMRNGYATICKEGDLEGQIVLNPGPKGKALLSKDGNKTNEQSPQSLDEVI